MNCALFAKQLKKNKTLKKILEKWQKILEKSGNFVSPEKWEPCCVELESKPLLVTASGTEGVKAYNTRKPDLEWSVVGRLTEMEEAVDAQSITVDKKGRLFVCDIGNHCIHTFTMNGKYLSTMIKEGQQGLGELRRIRWKICRVWSSLIVRTMIYGSV